ncbi:acyl carrier protein [Pseudomonas knackmussii]|uniref:acyl carrier protein n=1 Tax=Pseudomonas knackmussii TaxID=65741 RepID=UPI003F4A128E
MNDATHARLVYQALYNVAPDLEEESLDPEVRFDEQFEFDETDFARFVAELHRLTGVTIPHQDYPELATLANAVAYLERRHG